MQNVNDLQGNLSIYLFYRIVNVMLYVRCCWTFDEMWHMFC